MNNFNNKRKRTKKNLINQNQSNFESDLVVPKDEFFTFPDESILLDLDLEITHREMIKKSIKICISDRDLIGKINIKEQNKNILKINNFYVQIVFCGLSSNEVNIPLNEWRKLKKTPQIILAAQIDDENNIVYFPGVITSNKFIKMLSKNKNHKNNITLNIEAFEGGIDMLFSYVTLLDKNVLSREGIIKRKKSFFEININSKKSFYIGLIFTSITSILFFGNRNFNIKFAIDEEIKQDKIANYISKEVTKETRTKSIRESDEFPERLAQSLKKDTNKFTKTINFQNKCLKTNKEITTKIFDILNNGGLVDLSKVTCEVISEVDKIAFNKLTITTGRESSKAILCITDGPGKACKINVGEVLQGVSPRLALAKTFNYIEPKPKFLNETSSRLYINIYEVLSNK